MLCLRFQRLNTLNTGNLIKFYASLETIIITQSTTQHVVEFTNKQTTTAMYNAVTVKSCIINMVSTEFLLGGALQVNTMVQSSNHVWRGLIDRALGA